MLPRRPLGSGTVALLLLAQLRATEPAQDPKTTRGLSDEFTRIYSEALAHPQAYSKLQELCTAAPHRLSGSTGAAQAVAWARAEMEALGLENVRLEECSVPRWERGRIASLSVTLPEDRRDTFLPVLALGGSVGTGREGIQGELLVVSSFEELAALGDGARGKIVLF